MKSIRENPDGPENQAMERQYDRDVYAAQMQHKREQEEAHAEPQPRPTLRDYLADEIKASDFKAAQATAEGFQSYAEWHRGMTCAYRDILTRVEMDLFEP